MPRSRFAVAPGLRRTGALVALLALLTTAVAAPAARTLPATSVVVHATATPLAPSNPAPGVDANGAAVRRLGLAELLAVTGGTCSTCSDDSSSSSGGGGGGGTGSSGSVTATGSPYWQTYRVTLNSTYETPASLVSKIDNWSSVPIQGNYQYTYRVVRDVKFSGSFASFVSASVGGEVSRSTSTSVTYTIPSMSFGKLYVKYRTERRTYYGHQYQPMSDGSRVVVDSASGPYESTSTVLGYVTGAL